MIFKKAVINDKEVYLPIDREEAKGLLKAKEKLVFTDEDEKDDLEDEIEDELEAVEEAEEAAREAAEEAEEAAREAAEEAEEAAREAAEEAEEAAREAAEEAEEAEKDGRRHGMHFIHIDGKIDRLVNRSINRGFHWHGKTHVRDSSLDPKSKMGQLIRVLPFMNKDDLHELVDEILTDSESLANADIVAFLPFFPREDCDRIFLKAIKDGNTKYNPVAIAPFVSSKVLTLVVDDYLAGKLTNVDVDDLYPFLSSADVKRVFKHIIASKK